MSGLDIDISSILAKNLKTLRDTNRFSQELVGELLNVDRSTCSNWENGKTAPKISQLHTLSKFYNVSIDFLTSDHSNDFTLSAPPLQKVFGESFLSALSDEERLLLLKYRVLNENDKTKVDEYLDSLRKSDYYTNDNE
ncbi:MAG: helix-turn-helix domain-containing protein [Eubacterium sp.]